MGRFSDKKYIMCKNPSMINNCPHLIQVNISMFKFCSNIVEVCIDQYIYSMWRFEIYVHEKLWVLMF